MLRLVEMAGFGQLTASLLPHGQVTTMICTDMTPEGGGASSALDQIPDLGDWGDLHLAGYTWGGVRLMGINPAIQTHVYSVSILGGSIYWI